MNHRKKSTATFLTGSPFSKVNLVAFALIFAIIGGYIIYSSFAASPTCDQTFSTTDSISTIVSAAGSAPNGTIVCLNSGSYNTMTFNTARSGAVTVQPANGATVTIAGINFGTSAAYYNLSYLTVGSMVNAGTSTSSAHNNTLSNNTLNGGIQLSPGSHDWDLEHNLVNGGSGVMFYSGFFPVAGGCCNNSNFAAISNVTINGNKFYGPYGEDAIHVQGFSNVTITNNEFTHITSVDGAHADGTQSVWGGSGLTIKGNYYHDNNIQTFFLGKDGDISNVDIEDNLAVRNSYDDPTNTDKPSDVQEWMLEPHHVVVRNNTFVKDGNLSLTLAYSPGDHGGSNPAPATPVDTQIDHNVFGDGFNPIDYTDGGGAGSAFWQNNPTALVENYNVIGNTGTSFRWWPTYKGACSVANTNPTYINPATDDYRLASSVSACSTTYAAGVDWRPSDYIYGPLADSSDLTPTVTIAVSPTTITTGSSSTLSWSSTHATACTASNGWSGAKATSGSQSVSPTATTTYTLACTGTGGTTNNSATLSVNQVTPPSPTPPTPTPPTPTPTPTPTPPPASNTKYCDLNNDGTVNIFDLSIMLTKYGSGAGSSADVNHDSSVNIFDLSILLSNYGK